MNKVSVIIPTHNRENLIGRAIRSVQNQTRKVDEIIVVSDGSTDNTENVVKQFAKDDDRIKLISYHPSHNGNYARNRGIEVATGDIIAFLDDDDEWLPRKNELQMTVLEKNPNIGLVYSAQNCIYEKLNIKYQTNPSVKGDLSKRIFLGCDIGTPSQVMIRKSVLDKAGYFDVQIGALQDWDLWIRCCKYTLIDYVSEACINYYNDFSLNQVSANTNKFIDAIFFIRKKYNKEICEYGEEFIKEVDAKIQTRIARRCLRNNQKKDARKYALNAFKLKKNRTPIMIIISSLLSYNTVLKIRSKFRSAKLFW